MTKIHFALHLILGVLLSVAGFGLYVKTCQNMALQDENRFLLQEKENLEEDKEKDRAIMLMWEKNSFEWKHTAQDLFQKLEQLKKLDK